MSNSDTGSRTGGMDHDFLAALLGGEIQRNYRGGLVEEGGGLEFDGKEKKGGDSNFTDPEPSCSNCCRLEVTIHPKCDTKLECHTHYPHCKTHEEHCHHKKPYEPPQHASWFDKP